MIPPLYYLVIDLSSGISPMELCLDTWKLDPSWILFSLIGMDHCDAEDLRAPIHYIIYCALLFLNTSQIVSLVHLR